MSFYALPVSLNIGGADFAIRYDFRAVLDILIAMNDPDLDDYGKSIVILQILYPDWDKIPQEHLDEALEKACKFIDCGQRDDGKPKPRLIDWEQDAHIIIPAINRVAGREVRSLTDLHWWTFWGHFLEIGESLFSSVLNIRQKKARHKKLEKWEESFYKENRAIIDLKTPKSKEDKEIQDYFNGWL